MKGHAGNEREQQRKKKGKATRLGTYLYKGNALPIQTLTDGTVAVCAEYRFTRCLPENSTAVTTSSISLYHISTDF